ncbi:MAG: addiction module protein [Polyangia bacterium]
MIDAEQIEQMTREEKLRTIEALWEALSRDESRVASPSWHEELLRETEASRKNGRERIEDWEEAKRELRKRSE